jgi:hypothetical protein
METYAVGDVVWWDDPNPNWYAPMKGRVLKPVYSDAVRVNFGGSDTIDVANWRDRLHRERPAIKPGQEDLST